MSRTPLGRLIRERMKELGLRRGQLAARLGYRNISKGCRRLEQVSSGDLAGKEALLAKLPGALDLPREVVAKAIQETIEEIERAQRAEEERAEARWRADFTPHAIITTERSVPSPIFVVAFFGTDWLKRIDLEVALPVNAIHRQIQDVIQRRLARWDGQIPCFGAATGYVINWTPDRAERFDLPGTRLEVLDRAERVGGGYLGFRGRMVERRTISAALGLE